MTWAFPRTEMLGLEVRAAGTAPRMPQPTRKVCSKVAFPPPTWATAWTLMLPPPGGAVLSPLG